MTEPIKGRIDSAAKNKIKKRKDWIITHINAQKLQNVLIFLVVLWVFVTSYMKECLRSGRSKIVLAILCSVFIVGVVLLNIQSDSRIHQKNMEKLDRIMAEHTGEKIESDSKAFDIIALQRENSDCMGWLKIADTKVSYPVMQCAGNENYYLHRDFFERDNKNGSLILDDDSSISQSCDNLIIHGHNMKSGEMFGELEKYKEESYANAHKLITFKTAEETREYVVMAAFYSRVFYEDEEVFKYYKFFEARTEAEFLDFYENIKDLSLYDTGVTAEWGDKFITLSTCAYHEENGRFVVVGKYVE